MTARGFIVKSPAVSFEKPQFITIAVWFCFGSDVYVFDDGFDDADDGDPVNISMENQHFDRYTIYKRAMFGTYFELPSGNLLHSFWKCP